MRKISSYSLVHQFVAASVAISGAIILVLALFVSQRTDSMMLEQVQSSLQSQVHGTRKLMDTAYEISTGLTDKLSAILVGHFPAGFTVDEHETAQVGAIEAPVLRYQGRGLNLDFREVDDFSSMTGGVATLFVRQGEDFIRVTTSLKNEKGERAIGTRLAHDHPAYAKMLAGETYLGVATLFGKVYMTKYVPAIGPGGRVVAIMFVGFDLAPVLASLKATLNEQTYGRSGYGFVMNTAGPAQGVLMFHPTRAGQNLLKDGADAAGNNPFDGLLKSDKGLLHYPWKSESGAVLTQLLAFESTKSWGGVTVAGGGYVEDYTQASRSLRNTILIACGGAALALGALLWLLMLNRLRPVSGVVGMLERMGAGDMTVRTDRPIATNTRNELDIIARCVNTTAHNVGALIAGLHHNAAAIETTAQNLARTSSALSETALSQRDAAKTMAAGVEHMTGSVSLVSDRAQQSRDLTQQTLALTQAGQQTTDGVLHQMTQIESSVHEAAAHIEKLDANAQQISAVVSIIREIADQTNLLALNAAIEAARAGEQGRGFAVVADEVRKLAERTSKSTGEISVMVGAIQVGAQEAVVGMHNAVGIVKTGVDAVRDAQQVIGEIGAGAGSIAEASTDIALALKEQAGTSHAIELEVERISLISGTTAASAQDSATAVAELKRLSGAMSSAVAKFRVE
jgi:methyl-accepting chemotaxis protein